MDAATRVRKARTALLLQQPFFGTLAAGLALKMVATPQITAATDGLSLFINPQWVERSDERELKSTITEMVMHTALRHPLRRGFRDEDIWNRACDQAVFHAMVRARLPLRKGAQPDPDYHGMAAEKIYRLMLPIKTEEPEEQETPAQAPPPPPVDNQPDGGSEGADVKDSGKEPSPPPAGDECQPGTYEPEGEQESTKQKADNHSHGDGEPEHTEMDRDVDATSAGSDKGSQAEANKSEPAAVEAASDGNAAQPSCKGVGHEPGEVVDPPVGTDPSIADAQIVRAIRRAVKGAKHFGNLPTELESEINELLRHRQDWRSHLAAWMQQISSEDYTWRRPNKRYLASGLYLPSMHVEAMGTVVYAIDTSGSITQDELDEAADEATAVCDQVRPERVHVVYCDAVVQGVDTFERDDILQFARKGGGGTAFKPVFDWVEKQDETPVGVVYFTDGLGPFPETQPDYPVLWLIKGSVIPPWGEHVRID